ncbi:GNAT family N-acetyltransferase [Pedobacter sp. JCM 36344]|uniref:GNAT family N-acetyltransferase n=1 Tax=Pedobacter sp. JCM 36344 TaxID=3374280 RepID=UPI00397C4FBB
MDFTKNYILEDDRVLLRPLTYEDYELLSPYALTDPDTWRYSVNELVGKKGMREYVNDALKQRKSESSYPFIVYDKITGEYVGSTRFYDIQITHRTTQLGYTWYAKGSRGRGINKHCKYLLLQFAFETLSLDRVEFRADLRNEVSIAAMKSIGCKVEGILRKSLILSNGHSRDSIILSILKPEWESEVKALLEKRLL